MSKIDTKASRFFQKHQEVLDMLGIIHGLQRDMMDSKDEKGIEVLAKDLLKLMCKHGK